MIEEYMRTFMKGSMGGHGRFSVRTDLCLFSKKQSQLYTGDRESSIQASTSNDSGQAKHAYIPRYLLCSERQINRQVWNG